MTSADMGTRRSTSVNSASLNPQPSQTTRKSLPTNSFSVNLATPDSNSQRKPCSSKPGAVCTNCLTSSIKFSSTLIDKVCDIALFDKNALTTMPVTADSIIPPSSVSSAWKG